jgi:hypothetical protein
MEPSLSMRNSREIRGYEAAHRIVSSVKDCHVTESRHEMTPDIRHLGSVSREGRNNTFGCNATDGE